MSLKRTEYFCKLSLSIRKTHRLIRVRMADNYLSCFQVMANMLCDNPYEEEEFEDSDLSYEDEDEEEEYVSGESLEDFDDAEVTNVKRQSMYVPRRHSRRPTRRSIKPKTDDDKHSEEDDSAKPSEKDGSPQHDSRTGSPKQHGKDEGKKTSADSSKSHHSHDSHHSHSSHHSHHSSKEGSAKHKRPKSSGEEVVADDEGQQSENGSAEKKQPSGTNEQGSSATEVERQEGSPDEAAEDLGNIPEDHGDGPDLTTPAASPTENESAAADTEQAKTSEATEREGTENPAGEDGNVPKKEETGSGEVDTGEKEERDVSSPGGSEDDSSRKKSILKDRRDSRRVSLLPKPKMPKRFSVTDDITVEVYKVGRHDPFRKSMQVEEMGKEPPKSASADGEKTEDSTILKQEESAQKPSDSGVAQPEDEDEIDDSDGYTDSDDDTDSLESLGGFAGLAKLKKDHDLDPVEIPVIRTLPLHWFDDTSYDERLPEEWLSIAIENGVQHPVPVIALLPDARQARRVSLATDPDTKTHTARHIVFTVSKEEHCWTPAAAIGYHPVRQLYMVRRVDLQEYFLLPRIYVMFCAEDPQLFCERVKAAVELRTLMQNYMRYHLYVDCMPTSFLAQMDIEQVSKKRWFNVVIMPLCVSKVENKGTILIFENTRSHLSLITKTRTTVALSFYL